MPDARTGLQFGEQSEAVPLGASPGTELTCRSNFDSAPAYIQILKQFGGVSYVVGWRYFLA